MARSIADLYIIPLIVINIFNLTVSTVFSFFTSFTTVFMTMALLEGILILTSVAASDFLASTAARRFRAWNIVGELDKKTERRIHKKRHIRLAIIAILLLVEFTVLSIML